MFIHLSRVYVLMCYCYIYSSSSPGLTVSMHRHSDRDMAIPRMFDSNTPFVIVTGGSELSFLGKEDNSQGCEEEKDSLVQAIAPHLSRVMQHGTAKHVVSEGREASEEDPCVSIVAQAESKTHECRTTTVRLRLTRVFSPGQKP